MDDEQQDQVVVECEVDAARPDDVGERVMPTEVYTRVVGYLRPVQAMHAAKQREVAERVTFDPSVQAAVGENAPETGM